MTGRPVHQRGLRTVRARICAAAVLSVGAALVVAGVVLVGLVRRSLEQPMRGEARARAADVVNLMNVASPPTRLPPLAAPWPTVVQVLDGTGTAIASSDVLAARPALLTATPSHREPTGRTSFVFNGRQQRWRVDAVAVSLRGRPATVVVATSLAQVERSTRLIVVSLWVGVPLLVLLVGWLAWLLVGRALHPVEQLRRQVAAFEEQPHGRRVDPVRGDDEIGRLAATLNELLDRLERAGVQQGRFVADASHELRSPVANIRAALEVAAAHPGVVPWPEIADDVLAQNARMGRLVDDLLLLARAGGGAPGHRSEPVDLAAIVGTVADPAQPYRVPVRVRAGDVPATTSGDRAQLERVVENLVANAARHATSAVMVSVVGLGRWVELRVADDGPGVPADDRARIFLPFVRLDADRSRQAGGTGLGLAIVAEIVAAHGGTVSVADAHPGALFVVRLPAASGSQGPLRSSSVV